MWVLYRTVAWALPTDSVYRNDGERYGVSLFSWAKPTLRIPVVPNGECQVWLTVLALSLALSHGERGSVAFTEMMVNGMGFSMFSWAKPTLPLSVVPNGECQVGLTVLALSLTLSRGEREQIVGNQNNGRTLPSLRGKENKFQGITTIVEFQSSDSLSPWERARERAKPFGTPLSRFSKTILQNGYRQKRWSSMDVRPYYLISKV